MKHRTSLPYRALHRQRGLSLVELMVALTIGLFLMGAVGIIYVNTATASRGSTQESQMNEDAALALELVQQQIRLAGFSNVNAAGNRLFPGQAVFGCDGSFDDIDSDFSALACDAAGAGPDAIAVRYEATQLNSQTITVGGVTSPANCAYESLAAWAPSVAEGVPAAIPATSLALADNRYYIANDANNSNTPTLFCQGRTGAGFGAQTALIPNIEDLQIQYGVTALPSAGNPIPHQVAAYVNASDEVLTRVSVAPQPGAWSRVAAVRVCLVARSARPVPTGDNPLGTANPDGTTLTPGLGTYIDCGGVSRTVTDRFIRRAYTTTIQLRNVRPGLPADYVLGEYPWQFMYEN
jgi:type IV pilus assembly protein PilW